MPSTLPNPSDCCAQCDCDPTDTLTAILESITGSSVFPTKAAMRAGTGFVNYQAVTLLGEFVAGDQMKREYWFDETSTAADDDGYIIRPTYIDVTDAGRLIQDL